METDPAGPRRYYWTRISEYLTYKEWKLKGVRNVFAILLREYLTYKEWKRDRNDYLSLHLETVSTLPIRNGNGNRPRSTDSKKS